ncbi:hypothetical protein CAJAP_02146 [Camponotus japonicus]
MIADDSWKTQSFRQSVIAKIDEAMSGMSTTKNSTEMENHVFQKTKGSKEEYLWQIARLILHFREMTRRNAASMITFPFESLNLD